MAQFQMPLDMMRSSIFDMLDTSLVEFGKVDSEGIKQMTVELEQIRKQIGT